MCAECSFRTLVKRVICRIHKRIIWTQDATMLSKVMSCCCILYNIMLEGGEFDNISDGIPIVGHYAM